ncbi:MAG TPA: biopolymer transporter ExbD [Blastocatellia bacterium]|nr:biopolymer transporter ExbD [Blastocatellia bacterium]
MHAAEQEAIVRKKHVTPTINVTPLIDVLLVLLIIFMVIQPHTESKFESQVPQKPAPDDHHPTSTDLLVVDVKTGSGPDQTVELNSKPMSLIDLGTTLADVLNQRGDKTVFIKAPKDKPYGEVMRVIDVIKGAGAAPVGLQIDYLL